MEFIKDWLNEIIIAALTAIAIFVFTKYLHPFILGVLQNGDLMSLKGKTTFNHHDLGKIVSKDKLYKKVSTL